MINSTATRILLNNNDTGKIISGIEFTYNNQLYTVNVKREVVISAGAINSPQLLLLSGIGPKKELDKVGIQQLHNLPGVGQNLQNHVSFALKYYLNNKQNFNNLNWDSLKEYISNKTGPLSSTGVTQVTARINSKYTDPDESYPDLQFFFSGYLAQCSISGNIKEPENLNKPSAAKSFTMRPTLLRPKSIGYIGLNSKNPNDPPFMQPNYLAKNEDVEKMIDAIRIAQNLANTKIFTEKYGIKMAPTNYGDCSNNYT